MAGFERRRVAGIHASVFLRGFQAWGGVLAPRDHTGADHHIAWIDNGSSQDQHDQARHEIATFDHVLNITWNLWGSGGRSTGALTLDALELVVSRASHKAGIWRKIGWSRKKS